MYKPTKNLCCPEYLIFCCGKVKEINRKPLLTNVGPCRQVHCFPARTPTSVYSECLWPGLNPSTGIFSFQKFGTWELGYEIKSQPLAIRRYNTGIL